MNINFGYQFFFTMSTLKNKMYSDYPLTFIMHDYEWQDFFSFQKMCTIFSNMCFTSDSGLLSSQ